MKYFITVENNIINGFFYDDNLPENVNCIEVGFGLIDSCDILIGDNIQDYNNLWELKVPNNNRLVSTPVKYFKDVNHYTVNFVEPGDNNYNFFLSIGIICCDKDYQDCQSIIEKIHNWSFKNYEIIVVDNCEKETIALPNDVKHIKTNKNMFPFAGRQKIAEVAQGDYLWYIDGDDNVEEPNLSVFKNKNADIVVYRNHTNFFSSVLVEDLVDYCNNMEVVDGTLHNVFISNKIYKTIPKDWGNKVIWYFEDTLYLDYFLAQSKIVYVVNQCIYDYNLNFGGALFKMQNLDDLKRLCINSKDTLDIIRSNKFGKYSRFLENHYYFGIEFFLGIYDMVKYKDYLNKAFYYTSTYSKVSKLYDKYYIEPAKDKKIIDIIYVFYGTNIIDEIKYLKSKIHCNFNLIIIDYFNNTTVINKEYKLIKHTNFKNDLLQALEYIKNNVWILESYKDIKHFDSSLIRPKTTVYSNENRPNKYLSFDCERNNVIFTKNDFTSFIKDIVNFQSLESLVKSFVSNLDDYPICSLLVEPAPVDSSIINYAGKSSNTYFKYLDLRDSCIINNKDFFTYISANLGFKSKNIEWYFEDNNTEYINKSTPGTYSKDEYYNLPKKIKPHKKVCVVETDNNIGELINKYARHFKYLIRISDASVTWVSNIEPDIDILPISHFIDYHCSLNEIKNVLKKNKIVELNDKMGLTKKLMFTILPNEDMSYIINKCIRSWDNVKAKDISKKIYTLDECCNTYLKGIDISKYTKNELINKAKIEISKNYKETIYVPYNVYFNDIITYNIEKNIKPILNITYGTYYVFNVNLWNRHYDDIINNFDRIIVCNNTDIECINPPENYLDLSGESIYFPKLQEYVDCMYGNNVELVNVQTEPYLSKIIEGKNAKI